MKKVDVCPFSRYRYVGGRKYLVCSITGARCRIKDYKKCRLFCEEIENVLKMLPPRPSRTLAL